MEQLNHIKKEYIKELNDSEEHIPYDYHKFRVNMADTTYRATIVFKEINRKYLWHNIWTCTIRILFVAIPFIVVLAGLCFFANYN